MAGAVESCSGINLGESNTSPLDRSQLAISLDEEVARWDRAFQSDRLRSDEPDTSVVRYARIQLAGLDGRVLDLGCGYGRHLGYFEQQGFEAVGVDFSAAALRGAGGRLRQHGHGRAWLVRADFSHLPLAGQSFIGAVSIQAIYHGSRRQILSWLRELFRVLQPGARALVSMLSDRSSYFGRGEALEAKTFRLQGGVDEGAPHHFMNQAELQRLCAEAGFVLALLRLEEYQTDDGHRSSTWLAVLERPR